MPKSVAQYSLIASPRYALSAACTSCACAGVATLPVPIAQTGSYAMTTFAQSAGESSLTAASVCARQTFSVSPASRSCSVSPMQKMTLRPAGVLATVEEF